MKLRSYFVSNSSSSSFVCDFCGRDASGWDLCMDEAEMFECVNGHTVCKDHAVVELDEDSEDSNYDVPVKHCPICQFEKILPNDMVSYLTKKFNVTEEEVCLEIKERYKKFTDFKKDIKKKKTKKS